MLVCKKCQNSVRQVVKDVRSNVTICTKCKTNVGNGSDIQTPASEGKTLKVCRLNATVS